MVLSVLGRASKSIFSTLANEVLAISCRDASKKAGCSSRNKLNATRPKHRGWKKYDGDYVETNMILFKQLGLKVYPGENVGCGRDYTLYALRPGKVVITKEVLSPYPTSPLFKAVEAGRVFEKYFFHVIPEEPQKQVFKLVSQI